jgi:phage shock protein A
LSMADDQTAPATKGDIADLRSDLHRSADQLRERIENLESRLEEAIRDSQTEILKSIYGFTQTVQNRFQEMDQTEATLKRRMTTLEGRMLEVEKRLNIPPAA